MKKHIFFGLISLLFSCDKKQQVQNPVSYTQDEFIEKSKERAVKLYQLEQKKINTYIQNKKEIEFVPTSAGFSIGFVNGKKGYNETKETGLTKVTFAHEITDIEGNMIYSFEEMGTKKIVLGKENLTRGLQFALETLPKNEEVFLILPSFLAYGNFGDEHRIGNDETIVVHLKIINKQKP